MYIDYRNIYVLYVYRLKIYIYIYRYIYAYLYALMLNFYASYVRYFRNIYISICK